MNDEEIFQKVYGLTSSCVCDPIGRKLRREYYEEKEQEIQKLKEKIAEVAKAKEVAITDAETKAMLEQLRAELSEANEQIQKLRELLRRALPYCVSYGNKEFGIEIEKALETEGKK